MHSEGVRAQESLKCKFWKSPLHGITALLKSCPCAQIYSKFSGAAVQASLPGLLPTAQRLPLVLASRCPQGPQTSFHFPTALPRMPALLGSRFQLTPFRLGGFSQQPGPPRSLPPLEHRTWQKSCPALTVGLLEPLSTLGLRFNFL